MSIREMRREGIRWPRSWASLYRWARRGIRIVARRLKEDGITVPLRFADSIVLKPALGGEGFPQFARLQVSPPIVGSAAEPSARI